MLPLRSCGRSISTFSCWSPSEMESTAWVAVRMAVASRFQVSRISPAVRSTRSESCEESWAAPDGRLRCSSGGYTKNAITSVNRAPAPKTIQSLLLRAFAGSSTGAAAVAVYMLLTGVTLSSTFGLAAVLSSTWGLAAALSSGFGLAADLSSTWGLTAALSSGFDLAAALSSTFGLATFSSTCGLLVLSSGFGLATLSSNFDAGDCGAGACGGGFGGSLTAGDAIRAVALPEAGAAGSTGVLARIAGSTDGAGIAEPTSRRDAIGTICPPATFLPVAGAGGAGAGLGAAGLDSTGSARGGSGASSDDRNGNSRQLASGWTIPFSRMKMPAVLALVASGRISNAI